MTPRHGTGKADANQAEIVAWLRSIPGVYVQVLSQYPKQLDLLVYCNSVLTWWEIKPPGKYTLTQAEREIYDACPGVVFVVQSISDAWRILNNAHGLGTS